MPYAQQQTSTPAAEPSANDLAAQIRAQVNQQLKQAGVSQQQAQRAADAAAAQSKNITIDEGKGVTVITKNGKTVTIHTTPAIPVPPLAPIAPFAQTPDGPVTVQTGTTVPVDPPLDIPQRIENLGYALFLMIAVIAIGKPLVRAFGNIVERRALKPAMPAEFGARLERIEQGIESVSIEVERISESQRYLLKVQSPAPDRVELPRSAS
jgi:hypothetical protein